MIGTTDMLCVGILFVCFHDAFSVCVGEDVTMDGGDGAFGDVVFLGDFSDAAKFLKVL